MKRFVFALIAALALQGALADDARERAGEMVDEAKDTVNKMVDRSRRLMQA